MYSIPKCCCSPAFSFFSCSRWSVHNPSWILGKRYSSSLPEPVISVSWFSYSLKRSDKSFGSACPETGYATRFTSLKQCNISLAPGSEQRQKPQNENRAGGSQPQILWPHSCWKSGVQPAPGPWLKQLGGPVRVCCSSGWTRHLESSLRERSVCPPAKVAGHGQAVHLVWELRPRLVAWDIPVSETKDSWYWISPWRFLDQCPATP